MAGEHAASRGARAGAWIASLLWTALVLTASGEGFSADATRGLVYDFWAFLGVALEHAQPFVFWTRKGAHFVEYAVLAALVLRALRLTGIGLPAASLCALLWALGVAIGDESVQARLPSRTGSPRDVAIDFAGAATAVLLTHRLVSSREARE
jgi:VanZ family protein